MKSQILDVEPFDLFYYMRRWLQTMKPCSNTKLHTVSITDLQWTKSKRHVNLGVLPGAAH